MASRCTPPVCNDCSKGYFDKLASTSEQPRTRCGTHSPRPGAPGLEAGVDIVTVQRLLGHTALSTTSHYLHISRRHLQSTPSLLDLIALPKKEGQS